MKDTSETHPSWGLARFNRVSSSTGQPMFGSDVKPTQYVILEVDTASRDRNLSTDWLHPEDPVLQIRMTEAQFGALVSSFGVGRGVPVTLERIGYGERIEAPEHDSRLEVSAKEVREAGSRSVADITDALAQLQEAFNPTEGNRSIKKVRDRLDWLATKIAHLPSNMEFASKRLGEEVEATVQKAQADIEAMVDQRAAIHGLTAEQLGMTDTTVIEIESGIPAAD